MALLVVLVLGNALSLDYSYFRYFTILYILLVSETTIDSAICIYDELSFTFNLTNRKEAAVKYVISWCRYYQGNLNQLILSLEVNIIYETSIYFYFILFIYLFIYLFYLFSFFFCVCV